eukprot:8277452-Ditylum_brightwellii.AAC.1
MAVHQGMSCPNIAGLFIPRSVLPVDINWVACANNQRIKTMESYDNNNSVALFKATESSI